jgi:hypothetical protein
MSEYVVTVLDISGIQGYIFGSNKLRDNIGASQLVEWATKQWVYDTLNQAGGAKLTVNNHETFNSPAIEDGAVRAELIYAGGGNAAILFADLRQAKAWATAYSRHLLQHAPGLGFAIAHSPAFAWDPDGEDLFRIVDNLKNATLVEAKQMAPASVPLLSLGVTATCQSTGFPAVAYYDEAGDYRPVSSEVQAKLTEETRKAVDERFDKVFHWFKHLGVKLPYDFDHLVGGENDRLRDQGYIAVVHADGNAMGEIFRNLGARKLANRAYIDAIRILSAQVQQAGQRALERALGALVAPDARLIKPFQSRTFLPVRPIVYGGDDVTFVCDGQIGLALAARYLDEFEKTTEKIIGKLYTACAGITIVKAHYPFARAYGMSEDLCQHAKRWMHQHARPQTLFSVLDWHIAASGLQGELSDIRQRQYRAKEGWLTMRPIQLHEQPSEWRTWPAFRQVLGEFSHGDEWAGKRNKVMRLREVLREGSERTRQFLKLYRLAALPAYNQAPDDLAQEGWISSDGERVCGYFDVIEALEFATPLEGDAL